MEPEVETYQSEKSGKTIKRTVKRIVRVGRVRQSITRTIFLYLDGQKSVIFYKKKGLK